ncbi:MAG: cytochrome c [Rhodospirillaceae bacterium]|nr:cytochrome c [Rhodospirillaceae bacterium]
MPNDSSEQDLDPKRRVDSDVPQHKSPIIRMAIILSVVIIASIFVLYKTDRRSIKAYINIPELNAVELRGREAFNSMCASCHGVDGTGDTDIGPPLMHPYYRKDLLSDEAIIKAIGRGTPEDKWKYGHMPAQIDVSNEQALEIVEFYNALRRVNNLSGE